MNKNAYFFCMTVCHRRTGTPLGKRCGVVFADTSENAECIAWEKYGSDTACQLWVGRSPTMGLILTSTIARYERIHIKEGFSNMEKLEQAISDILDTLLGYDRQPDGTFAYEIDADYRDEMDKRTAIKILRSDDPMQTFWEQLDEWYQDCQWTLGEELEKEVRAKLTASDGPYPEGLPGEDGDRLLDVLQELVWFKLPEEHFTKQTFRVNIMIDTGDGNVDYTLNSVHPCWYGAYNEPIDARAGIAWLAKTQGYTKGRLRRVLCKGDMANPNSFLESMRVALANLSSAMSTVTFLVELTLAQLLELNRLIKLQDRNGRHYDSSENPYCGYIIIDKNTETGLYDPWNGDGSVFEIQLERDVKLPIKYIRSALPDGGDGYSIGSVYGMCGSAWTSGGVKTIHAPVKLTA